jgi:hypothetical protein
MASVTIEIEDLLAEMSTRELQELADTLYDDGYVPTQLEKEEYGKPEEYGIQSDMFTEALDKLSARRLQLSTEDEELIIKLASKL